MSHLPRRTNIVLACVLAASLVAATACNKDSTTSAPTASAVELNVGHNQTASAGAAVAVAPSVVVKDASGNPVHGFQVTYAVTAGGGSITGATATSDANGVAAVGSWTLGTAAGLNTLTASAPGLAGSPIVFSATSTAGAAAKLAIHLGNGQSAAGGATLVVPPSVLVTDAHDNPVSAFEVTFVVASGGGSVTGATATTDTLGIATIGSWTLGAAAGANTLTVTSVGLTGSPVTFTATGTAGTATQIALHLGNSQTATVATDVTVAPSVLIKDANNNPVSGYSVTFVVATGGGSVTSATALTDANGIATVGSWTLGAAAGANSLTVTTPGLTGSPVTFAATGTAAAAASLAINAGNDQSAVVATILSVNPSVIVKDAHDNPVSGVSVEFAVATGGGSVTGGTAVSGVDGIATLGSWTLGQTMGANTLTATATGLTGSPVTFTATGTFGEAASLAISSGNGQFATVGTTVAQSPAVIVKDQYNNPVADYPITFVVASGGGSMTGASTSTAVDGIAKLTTWTLGSAAGANSLTVTVSGLTGSPVTFTATGLADVATQIRVNTGNNQSAVHGTAVSIAPSVLVRDAGNNPVSGVSVSFAVASGGGSLTGASATTNASGIATVGSWTMGSATGSNTITATSAGLTGSPVTFTATSTAGAATQIAVNAGNNQSAVHGTAVSTAPSVIVRDAGNNPVSGISVTFAVASGGGSITGGSATTNASGIATVGSWTLGSATGSNTITATSAGLTGSPVTFTATSTAGAATQIAVNAGNNQSATHGTAVTTNPSVIVRDAGNNPVSGVSVTFAVASGGGSITGASATTNASGIATVGSWTLGASAGSNTITATSAGLTGSPVTFTATATASAATQIAIVTGNNQHVTAGGTVAIDPQVVVTDDGGNPVSGVTVTFTVQSGGGSVTGGTQTTNASGIATVTSWTVGNYNGTKTLRAEATVPGTNPYVTFTATAP